MKIAVAVLIVVVSSAFATGQENPPTNHGSASSVGLEIGQQAPTFALPDQFGHEHTNETLKGPKGTVILFFRSSDW
jgi:cytochrome oxidase Cu insertion factor (SCO1/SenC/PrrC family)